MCDSCMEIRQGNAVDVIEIDAATNRGIDEIRELRDAARYAPARDRYKIYILDEAHQITDAAFNALLKTLEEPPAHVIFMMATTRAGEHSADHPLALPALQLSRGQVRRHSGAVEDDCRPGRGGGRGRSAGAAGRGRRRLDARRALDHGPGHRFGAAWRMAGAVLSAAQIRELMGSVPNAVFERLLEAVAAGQSAELMEQLNLLVNAGHSPSSLARQMVRYLRNALMAKLGGEQTELLQISGDERARAARTALLFTEEELTRNLQIVLRTFDDLNYRQEQRFHLELGLLKLIHAQRLLPIEELLSGVAGDAGCGSSGGSGFCSAVDCQPSASSGVCCASGSAVAFAFWLDGHELERGFERFRATRFWAGYGFQGQASFGAFAGGHDGASRRERDKCADSRDLIGPVSRRDSLPCRGRSGQRIRRSTRLLPKVRWLKRLKLRAARPASNRFATLLDPRWLRADMSRPRSCWARERGRSMAQACASRLPAWAKRCWP